MISSPTKQLGELTAPAMGFGCLGLSSFYGEQFDDASELVDKSLDLGINFFDTADMYGDGHNETLLGNALHNKRQQAIIATKGGFVEHGNTDNGLNSSAKHIIKACEASLKRLNTDYIDLYYLHRFDYKTPIEETIGAMADLVNAGKIRYLGLCEVGADLLTRAHDIHPISALQTEYSLVSRRPEKDGTLALCQELNVGFVAYSPLSRSLLSGKTPVFKKGDFRQRDLPRFQGDNLTQNLDIIRSKLTDLAHEKHCSLAQLSLAWLFAQGDFIVPIPGTTKIPHLVSNYESLFVQLSNEELESINQAFSQPVLQGTRYSDKLLDFYQIED